MNGRYVCRVCLSDTPVDILSKTENEDLLMKLRHVGAISIFKDDHLTQLICRTCSQELQLAYDFISRYELTYNKLREIESLPSIRIIEKEQNTKVETIQAEMQAGNNLVAEIVIKEEMISDGDQRFEIFEIIDTAFNKNFQCGNSVVNGSDIVNDGIKSGLNSVNSEFGKRYPKISYRRRRDNAGWEEDSNEYPYAVSLHSRITGTIVKEELQLANDAFAQAKDLKQSLRFYGAKSDLGDDTFEATTSRYNNPDGNEIRISQCRIQNMRFHDDAQAQKKLLCLNRTGTKSMEYNKFTTNQKATIKQYQSETRSLRRTHLTTQDNKPTKFGENISAHYSQQQSSSALEGCDKWSESLSNNQQSHKLQKEHSKSHLFVDEKFSQSFSYQQQMETPQMADVIPASSKFEQCGKAFSREISLKHNQKWHSNPKLVTYGECGKSHSNRKAFKCDQCSRRFSSSKRLELHIRAHSNPKNKCEKCNKSFPYLKLLEKHQMLHSNPDLFKCDQCNKRYTSKKCLEQHKIAHLNPELLTCKQCNKSFKYLCSLKEHQLLHSNPDAFNCDICGKKFLHRSKLKAHQILHLNPEMLRCKQCEKTFEYVSSLREHEILHSNPDAFKCEVCEKRYSYKNSLVAHRKTHSNSKFTCDDSEKSIANEPAMEQYSSI